MDNVKNYDMGGHAYINIPSKIKKIEADTFSECINLKNVEIPEGVEEIGGAAFSETALEEIEIPSSVKNIGDRAFFKCTNIKRVEFKGNDKCKIEKIGYAAFAEAALEEIEIPASVKSMSNHVFANCNSLISVSFMPDNPENFGNLLFEGCNNIEKIYIPSGSINKYLEWFYNCKLPNGVNIYTVSQIGG